MPHQDRLNIAVFIDFDNIEIGVKNTLGQQFDVGTILEALKERGEVVTKIAYADWTRAGEYSRHLTQHAIRLVQRNLTPGGDKNGADINLALDALEMAFTHPHINAYVIVGGDSDFLSLVEKLKQYDKKVFVVGGRAFTSMILQRNCHEFIAYENLGGVRKAAVKAGRPAAATASAPIAQAYPIVRRALKILADREVSPQTGLLKSTLLQLDSTFSERNYGASSFLDFVEKLQQAGLVQLKHAGRSVMVEANLGFSEEADAAPPAAEAPPATVESGASESRVQEYRPQEPRQQETRHQEPRSQEAHVQEPPAGDAAEGVRLVGQILSGATTARWPMYLRNVKQILRAAGGFDERRYGLGSLMDLMRACQRDGLIRLERDRRGGLRVFQGPALQRPSAAASAPGEQAAASGNEAEPRRVEVDTQESEEAEPLDAEPVPIDTTAELLGRAKARRPRSRPVGLAAAAARTARKTTAVAPRKAAPRRTSRAKKTGRAESNDSEN